MAQKRIEKDIVNLELLLAERHPATEQAGGQHDGEVVAAMGSLSDAVIIQWVSDYRPQIGDKIFATYPQTTKEKK